LLICISSIGNRPAERETTKTWLTLYLESIRSLILEDLKVVNQLCVPVFPPHWNVCQMFLDFYHDALRYLLGFFLSFTCEAFTHVLFPTMQKETFLQGRL